MKRHEMLLEIVQKNLPTAYRDACQSAEVALPTVADRHPYVVGYLRSRCDNAAITIAEIVDALKPKRRKR